MQVIAHNLLSQFTNRQLNISTKSKGKSAEKLSSGYRINRAADDAAGLKISEKMRTQIRGLHRGAQNTQEGISWIQVADGAMNEMLEITQRIRELAVQAANDTNSQLERDAIDNEIKELRKEINMISCNTEYNKQKVFDNSSVTLAAEGQFDDLQIYNSSYDAATNTVAYGGFIFNGNRVSWDAVSPGMVALDANGNQVFAGGSYIYIDPNSGTQFNITCGTGTEVPKITRNIRLAADIDGIVIDGIRHTWDEIVDEDDNPPSGIVSAGVWTLNHNGASLSFFTGDDCSYSEMADAINKASQRYTWTMDYTGSENVKAVDAGVIKNLQLSENTVYNMMTPDDKLSFLVKADETGIWLEDSANPGAAINGSKQTWAAMGIDDADWNSGDKISKNYTYCYSDAEGSNDTYVAFNFVLDDVTSIDSVIDGLDGMVIDGGAITNSYAAVPDIALDGNIRSAYIKGGNTVYFSEEKELGRNFDNKTEEVSKSKLNYLDGTKELQVVFPYTGTGGIEYKGSSLQAENYLKGDLATYLHNIESAKKKIALSGGNPQDAAVKPTTIRDVLGENAITKDGFLSETVTITPSMELTDGEDYFKPGEETKTYPAACIDFAVIGSSHNIYELAGTGFNSDCKTCDNYYSIRFDDFSQSGTSATNETEEGFKYNLREVPRPDSYRSNYTLQIDINSLTDKGITTGEELAKAMISITSQCFDMHYTQYAADGSKFYIYDNREQNSGAPDASFDTVPLPLVNVDELSFKLFTDDGREMEMAYKYDFTDVSDWVKIEMQNDPAGDYVYVNGTDDTNGYRKYNAATDGSVTPDKRFSLTENFIDKSNGDAPLNSMNEVIELYSKNAIDKMLNHTNIDLNALNYTYMRVSGDENQNIAVKSVFTSALTEIEEENGIHIQNSSVVNDSVQLPKFKMNTLVLNLYKAGTKTYEKAQATIDMADDAIRVLSEKRSIYGAWQNRLEHIYANSCNMEENMQASESRIRDSDMADEMVHYSKHRILEQAGQAILAKANQSPQGVLSLIGEN